jgi:hypothetical protein
MKTKNELLEKNLKILQIFQPKLAERLRKRLEEVGDLSSLVSVKETDQGHWISGAAGTDIPTFFQKKDVPLPELEAPKKKSAGDLQCVFFVYGIGAPPHLFRILRKLPKSALAVVVVEPSLDLILHTFSLTSVYAALPLGCRISFFAFPEQMLGQEALAVNVRQMGTFLATSATVIRHAGEAEANGKAMDDLERELWRLLRLSIQLLGNTAEDTLVGVRNFALNVPWILNSPCVRDFSELYGRPCICVASGPSLEKNVHLLKEIQDRFVIIAADTAVKKLLSLGIRPHFATCLERSQGMYLRTIRPLLEKFGEECKNIVLIAAFVCTPQVIARWPGPVKIVGKSELALDLWLAGDLVGGELFPCGASVAHVAFSLANALQASSIALIGQDLAYGEEGESHAEGTAPKSAMVREQERRKYLIEVPGVNGKNVQTHAVWFSFLRIFESFVGKSNVPVYDCSQGGALIAGTQVCTLASFIEEKDVDLEPFTAETYDLARKAIQKRDTSHVSRSILSGFEERSFNIVERSLEILEEMESHVVAVSETLLPAQRRNYARQAALLLDKLHLVNAPLAFIGQSYTSLSGETFVKSRSMETMEQVYLWKETYSEIIEGHRLILRFFSQWFLYASKAVLWYGETQNRKEELLCSWNQDELVGEAADILHNFRSFPEGEFLGSKGSDTRLVRLNNLLARMDEFYFSKEDGELLWQMARFLEKQGRGERACRMIAAAQKAFEGQALPREQIIAFFQDSARILSKPDLTHIPLFQEALSVARNLLHYEREDLFQALERDIKNEWRSYLENARDSRISIAWDEVQRLHLLADICLAGDDFGGALRYIWSLVQRAYVEKDVRGKRYIQWLCKHLEIAFKAVREEDYMAGEDIVRELAAFPDPLAFYRPLISPGLLGIFQERGLNLMEETAEKEHKVFIFERGCDD